VGDEGGRGLDAQGRRTPIEARREMSLRQRIAAEESYGILLLLIVSLLIATAVAGPSPIGRAVAVIMEGGVLLYALWTSRAPRRVLRIAVIIVPVVVALAAVLAGERSDAASAAVGAAGAALAFSAIGAIGRQVVAHPRVDAATILGAVCAYLLVGILFASLFATVDALSDRAFFVAELDPRPVDFLYFSFVTLTTVGYGDLTAAGDLGRMLAVTEALLGQLYLVTVVALVIGNIGRVRDRS